MVIATGPQPKIGIRIDGYDETLGTWIVAICIEECEVEIEVERRLFEKPGPKSRVAGELMVDGNRPTKLAKGGAQPKLIDEATKYG